MQVNAGKRLTNSDIAYLQNNFIGSVPTAIQGPNQHLQVHMAHMSRKTRDTNPFIKTCLTYLSCLQITHFDAHYNAHAMKIKTLYAKDVRNTMLYNYCQCTESQQSFVALLRKGLFIIHEFDEFLMFLR